MDKSSIDALINYRFQRSAETVVEAELLFREQYYNTTINRLYYACFYAVSALLLKIGITAHTHSGVKSMLGLHFVSSGKLDLKTVATYYTLFEKRRSSDYDDFVYFDKDLTEELIHKTKKFLEEIQRLNND